MVASLDQYITHPLIKRETVIRRAYQENIFINCLNKNALVVIPTGLGKTIIALMLAVHRLSEKSNSRVIFLAPTKPLVNQHLQSFLDFTEIERDELVSITGTTSPKKRKELWEDLMRVAFMTPQVLQNDIITGLYSLTDVSLIIFDECHRAVGEYAYCFIAKKYVEESSFPQVLGLTASPGSTVEKINEIKQNLFIEHVEIRTEKDADVKPYIHEVEKQLIKIKLPPEFIEIKRKLEEKLKEIYKWLKQKELIDSFNISKVSRKDLLRLNGVINGKISGARDDSERYEMFYAKKLQANAIRISHMLELIETQGINALQEYLKKNEEKIKQNTANKSLKELFADREFKKVMNLVLQVQESGLVHPKLEKLKTILTSQIQKDKMSRILVFCHFRDSVNNIVSFFDDDGIIRAHKFVGQAHKGSDKGLTQKRQIELLEEFKEGIYNVLVGTSVAEEGLDIAECDAVIFYDVVPSAIRSIQRRGRTGRKKEGKVYVLIAEGTRDEAYFWAEKSKERGMKKSLAQINGMEGNFKKGRPNLLDFIPKEEENGQNNATQRIQGAEQFTIACDNRETASPVVRTLSLMGLNLQLENLAVADYVLSDRVGIERKAAKDFNDSIKDGRLFDELFRLKDNFERAILILEGDPFLDSNINENALYGGITSIILNLGITIYKTKDAFDTAKFLYHLAKKEQSDKKSSINLRFDKAPIEPSRLLEYIVAGIPGVNSLRARNLLSEIKTLQALFNSDIGDLTKVDNIGKKIAHQIYKISRYKYKKPS